MMIKRIKLKLRYLWLLIILSFSLDCIHCNYLANKYSIAVTDISRVLGFNWLSPIFGILNVFVCILIYKRALQNYRLSSKKGSFKFYFYGIYNTYRLSIPNKKIQKWIFHINYLSATIIFLVSVLSLIQDLFLFFNL